MCQHMYSKYHGLKNVGLLNLLCVIRDILLLTFWLLVIEIYTCYLIEDKCIETLFMN